MDAVRRTLSTLFVRRMGSALLLMLAMMDTLLPLVRGMAADTKDYGVVIDAGSSGSRVRIYSWASSQKGLPDFQQIHQHKHKPGISAFSDRLDKLREYIVPFLEEAKQAVPLQKHADTPIYLMATAGMRLLLEEHANAVIDALDEIFQQKDLNPFRYQSSNTRILSGEEEGVFAWIAANYLRGFFSPGNKEPSVGILELGGASTQIAFIPEGSILADKFPVWIAGTTYSLYVHSYLYYGQNYVVRRIRERLQEANPSAYKLDNPCMLKDDGGCEIIDNKEYLFHGTGDPLKCLTMIDRFIYKADEDFCYPRPCAIGTVYQPSISSKHPFLAIGAFVFPPKQVGALGDDGVIQPQDLLNKGVAFCQQSLDVAMNKTGQKGDFLSTECLMSLYMSKLFTNGYGFANDTQQIVGTSEVAEWSIEWPLGAIIYETERTSCRNGIIAGMVRSSGSIPYYHSLPWQHLVLFFSVLLLLTST